MESVEEIFEVLEGNSSEINSFGVERLGVFGSFSKDQVDSESDIDFLVEFKDGEKTYENYIGLKRFLEDVFSRDIDLATEKSLDDNIKDRVMEEVQYA